MTYFACKPARALPICSALASCAETAYGEMFKRLPEGMTFLSLHFNAPGDFEVIEPSHAYIRTDEYALFRTGKIKSWVSANGIEIVGMRTMRDWLRSEWSREQ